MAHDVFISYAVEDQPTADRVRRALEEAGLACWIAPRDIPAGRDYEEAIVEAIAVSRVFVLILSGHSNASPHVKREVQQAFAEGPPRRVIPFRIEPVGYTRSLGYYLDSVQWVDASQPPPEAHLPRLVGQVRAALSGPPGSQPPGPGRDSHLDAPPPHVVDDGRRDGPAPRSRAPLLVAAAAVALLVAVIVGYFVVFPRNPRGGRQVNAGVNQATPPPTATPTPNRATPTPQATPSPTRTPIRNLNIRIPANLRPLNANLTRPRN